MLSFIDQLIEEQKNKDISNIEDNLHKLLVIRFRDKLLLNANKEMGNFISSLSLIDRHSFFNLKITDIFNIVTPNRLYTEHVNDEDFYIKKIMEYLEEIKLGESGRGSYTKDMLPKIGGNPSTLRQNLLELEKQGKIYSVGKTRTKTWVLSKFRVEAIKKWNIERNKKS